jgi:hypothetical protein
MHDFKFKYGPWAIVAGASEGLGAELAKRGLGKGPAVIPGFTNKMAHFFMGRLFPGKLAISITDNNTKQLS